MQLVMLLVATSSLFRSPLVGVLVGVGCFGCCVCCKQKKAYEVEYGLVGAERCIRDSHLGRERGGGGGAATQSAL